MAHKCNHVSYVSLDPVNLVVDSHEVVTSDENEDNDITVIMSNTTAYRTQLQQNIPPQVTIATTTAKRQYHHNESPKLVLKHRMGY